MMRGSPIVDAKVSMPPPNRWNPDRASARAALDRGYEVGVTVVAAGPGYLKRQLVESWARLDPDRPVAWVSLDEADDPQRLLVHSLAAVQSVLPGFASDFVLEDLVGPGEWEVEAADRSVQALGGLSEPLVLVFDGIHRLADPQSRRGLETLIRYRPEPLRIIVITRDDAAIDLSSARMAGSVVELREPDLALDIHQTLQMLTAGDVEATERDAAVIHAATGGWPAGIAMAASRRTSDGRVAPFAPDEEPVQSYLRNRVMDVMDDDLASFFLQVAPLRWVHPDLATHVSGRADAGRLLDRLTELHLVFDDPSRRPGWRTVPEYLQRFALHELRAGNDVEARAVCRRAAVWCWERELLDESMTIAACGEDVGLMAEILLEHHLAWTAGGQAGRVRAWCTLLLQAEPNLVEAQLVSAWASLFLGDDTSAASVVALVEAKHVDGDRGTLIEGELAVIRSHLARRRGEPQTALKWARDGAGAVERLSPGFTTGYRGALPSSTALHIGIAALWADEVHEAVSQLEAARAESIWASQALSVIHGYLAIANWLLDEDAALAHTELALMHVQHGFLGAGDYPALCMGLILGIEGVGDDALGRVRRMAPLIDEPVASILGLAAEAMHLALLKPAEARDALRRGRMIADTCPEPGSLRSLLSKVAMAIGADREPMYGEPLTEGELRVLRMLSGPLTEREIAGELHLSHNTVRTYRRRLYKKLGLTSRDDVATALETMRMGNGA